MWTTLIHIISDLPVKPEEYSVVLFFNRQITVYNSRLPTNKMRDILNQKRKICWVTVM